MHRICTKVSTHYIRRPSTPLHHSSLLQCVYILTRAEFIACTIDVRLVRYITINRCSAKEREKISIGLNLKFERRNKEVGCKFFQGIFIPPFLSLFSLYILSLPPSLLKMPGYCRRTTEGWAYSPAAIGLVKSYVKEFPAVFSYLQGNPKADKYYESELMPANAEE